MGKEMLLDFFKNNGWKLVYSVKRPSRTKELFLVDKLFPLSAFTERFLVNNYPEGLFRHQLEALSGFFKDFNVGITTGTASGKSLVFYIAAVESFCRDPDIKILAIYSLKALARE